jgi:ABC-type multidrug transport system permease subunit
MSAPVTNAPAPGTVTRPAGPPTRLTTVAAVAARSGYKMLRTPQVAGIAVVQSLVFLFMFRFVIGGAIGVPGVAYVDFLVPGFVVAGLLFTAGSGAVGTAEDAESGLFDRLRSLPIHDTATLTGRVIAEALLLGVVAVITLAAGFVVGFRMSGPWWGLPVALGLLVIYSLTVAAVFMILGLVAGSGQAAQGLSILGVPFSFISSAFVPVATMPAVLKFIAEWQPLTFMVNSWRGLLLGDKALATFEHGRAFYIVGSLVWCAVIGLIGMVVSLKAYRKE